MIRLLALVLLTACATPQSASPSASPSEPGPGPGPGPGPSPSESAEPAEPAEPDPLADLPPQERDRVLRQQASVERIINDSQPAFRRCWERAAADDFHLSGQLILRVTVDDTGRVASSKIESTLADSVLFECLTALASTWTLDGFEAGDLVEVPIRYEAPDRQFTVRAEDAPADRAGLRRVLTPASAGADQAQLAVLEPGKPFTLAGPALAVAVDGDRAATYVPAGQKTVLDGKRRFAIIDHLPPPPTRIRGKVVVRAAGTPGQTFPIAGGLGSVDLMFETPTPASAAWLRAGTGVRIPEHQHAGAAEILFVTAGAADMLVGGQPVRVEAGMAVYIPADTLHSAKVTETFETLQFYAPAGAEQRFRGSP